MNLTREMWVKLLVIVVLMIVVNTAILSLRTGAYEFESFLVYMVAANAVCYLLLFESLATCYDLQVDGDRLRVVHLVFRSRNREFDLSEILDLKLEKARLKTSDTARTLVAVYHPDYAERITLPYLTPRVEGVLEGVFERFEKSGKRAPGDGENRNAD